MHLPPKTLPENIKNANVELKQLSFFLPSHIDFLLNIFYIGSFVNITYFC